MIQCEEIHIFNFPRVTAASGLVLIDGFFYCVSDDELSLIRFLKEQPTQGESLLLFSGDLPADAGARKHLKPDLEALVLLPETREILCIPSGSTESRYRGALRGRSGVVREIAFHRIYATLRAMIPDLNLEGAVVRGSSILLFHRGNAEASVNAVIEMELESFLMDQPERMNVVEIDLGCIGSDRLCFTDACFFRDHLWFLAVVEKTDSTYFDGAFGGAVLGRLNSQMAVDLKYELNIPFKPEGLVIDRNEVYLVTDSDDRTIPSRLYRAALPG